ncbi:MAG: hypothetical protein KDC92_02560 [Bacteroidetes bacterium]|nr:hypothetical protein [Bacteroidota bacterium]
MMKALKCIVMSLCLYVMERFVLVNYTNDPEISSYGNLKIGILVLAHLIIPIILQLFFTWLSMYIKIKINHIIDLAFVPSIFFALTFADSQDWSNIHLAVIIVHLLTVAVQFAVLVYIKKHAYRIRRYGNSQVLDDFQL